MIVTTATDLPKLKSSDIAKAVARAPFNYRRFVLVENVSWAMLPWEADLLALSSSGYLYEVEIKVSVSDLRRDSSKRKWTNVYMQEAQKRIRCRWFAMPLQMWMRPEVAALVPDHAGVITVRAVGGSGEIAREAKRNPLARKASDAERFNLARLGAMRHWTRKFA